MKKGFNKWREVLFQQDWKVVPVGLNCCSWSNMIKNVVDGIDFIPDLQRWCGSRSQMRTYHVNILCGVNKSFISQLNITQFGTESNTTEYYTTVFESDDKVRIWYLEFLTAQYQQLTLLSSDHSLCPLVLHIQPDKQQHALQQSLWGRLKSLVLDTVSLGLSQSNHQCMAFGMKNTAAAAAGQTFRTSAGRIWPYADDGDRPYLAVNTPWLAESGRNRTQRLHGRTRPYVSALY